MAIFLVPQEAGAELPSERAEKYIANLRGGASEFIESTSEDDSFSYRNVRLALKNDRGILSWATDKSNGSVVHLILPRRARNGRKWNESAAS